MLIYNNHVINSSIDTLKGIGEKRCEAFNAYGIYTIRDLLYHFPIKYKDLTNKEFFNDKVSGEEIVAFVKVVSKPFLRRLRNKFSILGFDVSDGKSIAKCIYFNQPYLEKNINRGDEFIILGRIEQKGSVKQINNPTIVRLNEDTPKVLTFYRLPKEIKQKTFLKVLKKVFIATNSQLKETLPDELRNKYSLCTLNYAVEQIHFPESLESLKSAKYRIAFEEMLLFIIILRKLKSAHKNDVGLVLKSTDEQLSCLLESLPYELTNAQKKVVKEIRSDIAGENLNSPVMNRLLQGDVGSGKTVIAMIGLYISFLNGYQGVMMAPTEILANQHYNDCKEVLEPLGIKISMLTSSMKQKEKREIIQSLKDGGIDVVVGTHALIQSGVEFDKLGIAITDEQHRFGVNQRALLSNKGQNPHVLVMSATPVPRTLALIMYGDLDISVIDELPPGRKPIETRVVPQFKRGDMYKYLAEQISANEQAYIVCPLIEESDKIDVLSAKSLFKEFEKGYLKGINIGLVHGRLKDEEKRKLIGDFASGEVRALVSTTVIEVGVNVPNATIMIIENAERFGLAQLHQLRGRVGRSDKASWCFMTIGTENETSKERLEIMTKTSDGFVIAEKDLEMRGPGQFLGLRQSGLLDKRVIALMSDVKLIADVKEAIDLLEKDEFGESSFNQVVEQANDYYKHRLENIVLN